MLLVLNDILNIFLPEENCIFQKKQKLRLLGEKKYPKCWNSLKSSLIIFFSYMKLVIKNFCKIFWNICSYIFFSFFTLLF